MSVKKTLCLIMSFIIVVSAFVFSSSAEDEMLYNSIRKIATVNAEDNDNYAFEYLFDRGYTGTITAVQNPDGTYCLCIVMADGSLSIVELNRDFSVKNTVAVPLELSAFLTFCKGEDGTYYLLFNQPLTLNERNKTALRVINVDQTGKKLRSLDMSGMASGAWLGIAEQNCGNSVMAANGNYLTGYIARDMFPVVTNAITGKEEFGQGGIVHQASYAFAIDLETFVQEEVVDSTVIPYASHSFHQFILKDGNDFLYVDRCDAEPYRAYHLTKMSGGLQWKELREGNSFIFKGPYAQNYTYGQLAGVVRCGGDYLLIGSYENTTSSLDRSAANIFVQKFDVSTLDSEPQTYLTSYTGTENDAGGYAGVRNPKAIKVDNNHIVVPYMLCNSKANISQMRVLLMNSNGDVIWDKAVEDNSDNPSIPKFGQVYFDSETQSIVWFSIVNKKLISNSISVDISAEEKTTENHEQTTVPESPTVPDTGETATTTKPVTLPNITVPETTAPAENTTAPAENTTAPAENTTAPQNPPEQSRSFWQKIVDFFVSIYNFFVSLFT